MFFNNGSYSRKLTASETVVSCDHYRIEPKLCRIFCFLNMDMRRFIQFSADKEESVSFMSQDNRHTLIITIRCDKANLIYYSGLLSFNRGFCHAGGFLRRYSISPALGT